MSTTPVATFSAAPALAGTAATATAAAASSPRRRLISFSVATAPKTVISAALTPAFRPRPCHGGLAGGLRGPRGGCGRLGPRARGAAFGRRRPAGVPARGRLPEHLLHARVRALRPGRAEGQPPP